MARMAARPVGGSFWTILALTGDMYIEDYPTPNDQQFTPDILHLTPCILNLYLTPFTLYSLPYTLHITRFHTALCTPSPSHPHLPPDHPIHPRAVFFL